MICCLICPWQSQICPGQSPWVKSLGNTRTLYSISCTIPHTILLHRIWYSVGYQIRHNWYLRILVLKAMAVYVEGIAQRFGSSVEQVAFPLDATKRVKVSMRTENGQEDPVIRDSVPWGYVVQLLVSIIPFIIRILCTILVIAVLRRQGWNRACKDNDVLQCELFNIFSCIYRVLYRIRYCTSDIRYCMSKYRFLPFWRT